MTLDELALSVVPGDGLVARFDDVVLLAMGGRPGDGAGIDQLLAMCRAVGEARSAHPADALVDQLSALLGGPLPLGPDFCMMARHDESVEIVLSGEVEVTVARGGHSSRHAGPDPHTWLDLVVDPGFDAVVVARPNASQPVDDVRLDLRRGVVPGSALRLSRRGRIPGDPTEAESAATPAPGPVGRVHGPVAAPAAHPWPDQRAGYVSVPIARESRVAGRPLALAADLGEGTGPSILALVCAWGHGNDPVASYCLQCGRSLLDGTGALTERARPSLGVLVLDSGDVYALDRGYVIGADPEGALAALGRRATDGDRPRAIALAADGCIGLVHAEVSLDGWRVMVVDHGSVTGTSLRAAHANEWVALVPETPTAWPPHAVLRIGTRTLQYLPLR